MCGIVGYVGTDERAQDVLLDGLRRLEYRGYDSAGIAVVENHRDLRSRLSGHGAEFQSDTDTEIIAHLIHEERKAGKGLLESVRSAVRLIEGSYAIAVLDEAEPDRIVVAKEGGSPAIVSFGDGEGFVASDIPAILPYTRRMIPLEDGDVASVGPGAVEIYGSDGARVERDARAIHWDPIQAEKGGYDRFMQKEIFEQPRAISDTIGTRVLEEAGDIDLDGIEFDPDWIRGIQGVHLVAMGTARHACLLGATMIEQLARLPADVDLASEYRYREPVVGPSHLVIPVSQSGETTDTLMALREAKRRGALSLAVCNTHDSTIVRDSDHVLYTHAGLEIGVASTKCFTAQIVALYLIALKLARLRGTLAADQIRDAILSLRRIPRLVEQALSLWDHIEAIAQRYFHCTNFLYLGRGVGVPIALEGALKLKEISYIHAEGYAAGEMKHGPIALIDENMPVVIVANRSDTYSKVLANAAEVRARQGIVIAIADQGDDEIRSVADEVIYVPRAPDPLCAIVSSIPLQIFAYHIATLKGTDVDMPRNLAKSVTVE
jgi:glucosamine--fructose-6-phosphate aminotransferase (isomerizing)